MGGCNDLIISGHCTIYAAVRSSRPTGRAILPVRASLTTTAVPGYPGGVCVPVVLPRVGVQADLGGGHPQLHTGACCSAPSPS